MDFFYKKGQAQNYRLIYAVIIFLLGLFAAWRWFKFFRGEFIADFLPVDWAGVAVLIVVSALVALFFSFSHNKSVDYIIDTDEEMRKVSWPNKDELKANSIIVVVVMVILGVITTSLDAVFVKVFALFNNISF